MIAIVHSVYSQSVHALALNAVLMDNDAGRYCTSCAFTNAHNAPLLSVLTHLYIKWEVRHVYGAVGPVDNRRHPRDCPIVIHHQHLTVRL